MQHLLVEMQVALVSVVEESLGSVAVHKASVVIEPVCLVTTGTFRVRLSWLPVPP